MEKTPLGKTEVKFDRTCLYNGYQLYLKQELRPLIIFGLLGIAAAVIWTVAYYIPNSPINYTPGIVFIGFAGVSFLVYFLRLHHMPFLDNFVKSGMERHVTATFYDNSLHFVSTWDNGRLDFTLPYAEIEDIRQNKDYFVIIYNYSLRFLCLRKNSLPTAVFERVEEIHSATKQES